MFIFFLIIASIGYFMYRWYEVVDKVNIINRNTILGTGIATGSLTALASLHQPCVTTGGAFNTGYPTCNKDFNLTCVTGMYLGNGDGSNTGVCLSDIGGYCSTLYDCVPTAQACIDSICENITETINLPCSYDSDCIGGSTCKVCSSGSGPCKDTNGNCFELQDGICPTNTQICDQTTGDYSGGFRYNHICDISLPKPVCKYNYSPKDQGCSSDSECIQPDGGAICYTGGFKSDNNPTGVLIPPTYPLVVNGLINADNKGIIKLNFGNSLVTINSFEKGTEVNFVYSDATRTTISVGPYYLLEQYDNDMMSLTSTPYQPSIAEYVYFPNKYIQLNEDQYTSGDILDYTVILNSLDFPNPSVVFGKLPPLQILSTCYYKSSSGGSTTFQLTDADSDFTLQNGLNVITGTTEVRFRVSSDGTVIGDINQSTKYILTSVTDTEFTINQDLSHLSSYNTVTNTIEVMFGKPIDPDLVNSNKGVCVMKLPPSANITLDSKYDLTEYPGNPCVDSFDNTIGVSAINGFCEFTNVPNGPGSVCQFSRGSGSNTYDPLPCEDSSITYEGITYNLTCLINDDLTETIRNNPNFLNSSYGGICAYPVHKKFKSCEIYEKNCQLPYVCTEFAGGNYCDSRFDVLQCNSSYSCPPGFTCDDGICLSVSGGYCVDNNNCENLKCGRDKLYLSLYNASIDTKTSVPDNEIISNQTNQIIQLQEVGLTGTAKDYKLFVNSVYDNDSKLITYAFIYKDANTYKFIQIDNPLGTPEYKNLNILATPSSNFIFDSKNQKLYTYSIQTNILTLTLLFDPSSTTAFSESYTVTGSILGIDINDDRLLITSQSTITGRPTYSIDGTSITRGYIVTYFEDITNSTSLKTYTLPYQQNQKDNLDVCRFDLLNVNDIELDVVSLYKPSDESAPIMGVRNKVREFNGTYYTSLFTTSTPTCPGDIGCYVPPVISFLKSVTLTGYTNAYLYLVSSKSDINTIFAFSSFEISIDSKTVIDIIQQDGKIYVSLNSTLGSGNNFENLDFSVTFSGNYAPFSFSDTSNLDNYGNTASIYLQYPYWIADLQDLIVGDDFNPQIKRVFYQPDRVNRNYYVIANMYTGYSNSPIENKILDTDQNFIDNNMYLFRFSSLNNEIGLPVNETLPIRVFGVDDVTRFSQCNQTQNMFFLTNVCN